MGTLLNKREQSLFDKINVEVYRLASAENVILWQWQKFFGNASSVSGSVDCLYGEPIAGTKHFTASPKIYAHFEKYTNTFETSDDGSKRVLEGRVFVSRKVLEDAKIKPDENGEYVGVGDVFQFFNGSPKGFYLQIKNFERDGYINDQDTWTQYICDVVYDSSFTPEQQLEGST